MTTPFAGLFSGSESPTGAPTPATPAAATAAPQASFSGLFSGNKAVAPTPQPTPATSDTSTVATAAPIAPKLPPMASAPTTLPKYFQGDGYGPSNITDPTSGRPLLWYENQQAKSSQLLSDRTDVTFDPTKAQPVDATTLHNPRMALSVSQGIRNALGMTVYQQLDHIIPLELGGSNNDSNLAPENDASGKKNGQANAQPSAALEDSLKSQVASGQISLLDAWKQIAASKGITLPEQGGSNPSVNQTQTENPPSLFDKAKAGVEAAAKGVQNGWSKWFDFVSALVEKSGPTQFASNVEVQGFKKAITDVFATPPMATSLPSVVNGIPVPVLGTMPMTLNSQDIDAMTQKAQSYMAAGMDRADALTKAAIAVRAEKSTSMPFTQALKNGGVGGWTMQNFPSLMSTLSSLQTNPLSLGSSVKQILETPFTDDKQASDAFNAQLEATIQGFQNHDSASEDINNVLEAGSAFGGGIVQGAIGTWFNAASKIPIVGSLTKLIFNVPFAVLGDVSGDVGVGALQTLQQRGVISQQTADTLTPGVRATTSLAGQIIAGKYATVPVLDALTDQFGSDQAKAIIAQAQQMAQDRRGFISLGADGSDDSQDKTTSKFDTPEIIKARAENESTPQTSDIDTPEREEMRQNIADKLYGEGAETKGKRADIVMGPPAAGKSSQFINPIMDQHGSLLIDPDEVKKEIPEFNGKTSTAVQKESAQIAIHRILPKAIENGDNVVIPTIGRDAMKIRTITQKLGDAGYDVHIHLNDIPADVSAQRAVKRFMEGGQFVDPDYIVNGVADNPLKVYNEVKNDPEITSYEHYENNVKPGESPNLIERGGREGAGITPIRVGYGADTAEGGGQAGGTSGSQESGETVKGTTPTPNQKQMVNAFEQTRAQGVSMNIDSEIADQAAVDTVAGKGKSGVAGFASDLKNAFEDWVNQRAGAKVKAFFTKNDYASLDSEGMDGIFKFQAGESSGKYGELRQFLDQRFDQLEKAGVDLDYKKNYAPQLWNNTQDEIKSALGERRLGLHPSFTMESVFKDYEEGIKAGLTPKYTQLSDLAGWYEQRSSKLLADHTFFTTSGEHGWIMPTSEAPEAGWRIIDPNVFPLKKATFGDTKYVGTFSAPGPLADAIDNYLKADDGGFKAIAKFTTLTKNIILTTGIPNTALNFHGFTELARTVLSAENPITAAAKTMYWLVKPSAAEDFIMNNADQMKFFADHGLTFSSEDHALEDMTAPKINKVLSKERDALGKFFSDPLFKKVIPALKLDKATQIMKYLADHGYDADDAAKIASKQANDFYGGLNLDQIGRGKGAQNLFRTFLFAPDFIESSKNIGTGIVSSLKDFSSPEGHAYRVFARNLVMAYVGMNVINKMTSGKYMYQNDVGHEFDIAIGKDASGKTRYLRPLGTSVDFVRIPVEFVEDIATGNEQDLALFLRDRLSVPLGTVITLATGQDAYGDPIYDPNASATTNGINALQQVAGVVAPQAVQAGISYLRGKIDSEQAVSQTLGLPVRYQTNSQTTDTIATMIYTNRPKLESRIKADYANGDTTDAMTVMTNYNQQLISSTIQDYKDHGYNVTDYNAFYQWLVSTDSSKGGIKDFLLKPPSDKTLTAYKGNQGKNLFQKMFNQP